MSGIPTRTLRDYLSTQGVGPSAGVVGQNLNIVTGLASSEQAVPGGGTTGQTLVKTTDANYDYGWADVGAGDMLKAMYDPQLIEADAFARANHTGTQPASTITGLAAVATSGAYADLSGTPAPITYLDPRVQAVASTATLTPNTSLYDVVAVTAQAAGLTVAAPTGSMVNGKQLVVRIRDNGVARAITWNAAYVFYDASQAPVTTVVGRTLYVIFMYNTATSTWDAVGGTLQGLWG